MAGRPRNPQLDAAITNAGLRVLRSAGYEAFSVGRVATEVGTPRSTIYARWHSRADLLDGLLAGVLANRLPKVTELRPALVEMIEADLGVVSSGDGRSVAQLLLASQGPHGPHAARVRAGIAQRRAEYLELFTRDGVEPTAAEAAVDLAMLALWGRAVLPSDVQPLDAERLADTLLAVARASDGATG